MADLRREQGSKVQGGSSFQSESTESNADAEVSVNPRLRGSVTANVGADRQQELERDREAREAGEELRPEARSRVTPDDPGPLVGDDATAEFDNGPSNPTDRASSEALSSATAPDRENAASGIASDMRRLNTEDADPDTDRP